MKHRLLEYNHLGFIEKTVFVYEKFIEESQKKSNNNVQKI